LPSAWIFFRTRIGWIGHGSFAFGLDFLEHGFDGWDTDLLPSAWIFGTRMGWMGHGSFAFGLDFGTRMGWMGHGFFAFGLDFLEHGLDGWDTDLFGTGIF
jgi:hypothetical protein